jgi:hypothetical protein
VAVAKKDTQRTHERERGSMLGARTLLMVALAVGCHGFLKWGCDWSPAVLNRGELRRQLGNLNVERHSTRWYDWKATAVCEMGLIGQHVAIDAVSHFVEGLGERAL